MKTIVDYNPWPGLSSYDDPATANRELKFCGRDNDSYDVAELIKDNIFVTLYGKSGIGKTSLLNAGVFPELRKKHFSPLSLRLGMRDENNPQNYQNIIIEAVKKSVFRVTENDVIPAQDDQQSVDYLWKFFANHRFYDKDDNPTIPVIVLDQFEEVFRYIREKADMLLRQIDNCAVNGTSHRYELNVRFVVSIREDDLYLLEDSIDNCYLPALKRCRYRLRSLKEDGAKEAIVKPGEGLFRAEEQDAIVQTIVKIARNKDDQGISTNLLSLICNRLYVESQKSGSSYISLTLVDSFVKDNPFERFYNEATHGLSNREKSYIEEHFVDSTGRRNSIPESDFLLHVKEGKKLIEGKNRILQRVSTSSDGKNFRIELIHDSFCEPLAALKEKREKKKRIQQYASVSAIFFTILFIAYISFLYSQLSETNKKMLVAQSRYIGEQATRLAKENDSYMARILALQALPPNAQYTTVEAESALRLACQKNDAVLRGHLGPTYYAAFSPDGTRIVSTSNEKTFRIWDAETGKQITLPLEGHTDCVNFASFSPDGERIVSASRDSTIRIWKAETGEQIGPPLKTQSPSTRFSFSPDGKRILTLSGDSTIKIWSTETSEQIGPSLKIPFWIYTASFKPDGKHIVSFSDDSIIRIWSAETGVQIGLLLKIPIGNLRFATFSPDCKRIALTSKDNTIRIWDAETGKQIGIPLAGHTNYVYSPSFSPDGKKIVSTSIDKTIRIWDVETGVQIGLPLIGHTDNVYSASFSPDGTRVVSASYDRTVRIWDASIEDRMGKPIIRQSDWIYFASFSPDGKRIVSASNDSTIRIWDAESGQQIGLPLAGHTGIVRFASFSPDGKKIVSASSDRTIRIWDAENGMQIGEPLVGHSWLISSVSYSPSGKRIVSASVDKTIRIWDAEKGTQIGQPLVGHSSDIWSASFSPDGKLIVSASDDKTIRIWDAETGQQIGQPLEGHTDAVNSASFSPDGKLIVSASRDNTIRKWDSETGRQIGSPIEGHTDDVGFVSFSPDGKRIVSASNDKTIRIWDIETGKQIGPPLVGHTKMVSYVAFSPDGKRIVSASWDGTIRIWDYPSLQQLIDETTKRFEGRKLTEEERKRYYIE